MIGHTMHPREPTHAISGAVIGSGAAKRLSAVRWGVVRGLMRGDPATLKMGYSAASAALTVRDMHSLSDGAYQALLQYADECGLGEGRAEA